MKKQEWSAPRSTYIAYRHLVRKLFVLQKKSNNSDIQIFGLSSFCVPITHIDINICLNFNPILWIEKKFFESETEKCNENSVTVKQTADREK